METTEEEISDSEDDACVIKELDCSEEEFGLINVVKATRKLQSYGFENREAPISQWKLNGISKTSSKKDPEECWQTELFNVEIRRKKYTGQLTLTRSNTKWSLNLKMKLVSSLVDRSKSASPLVTFFVMKFTHFNHLDETISARSFLALHVFDESVDLDMTLPWVNYSKSRRMEVKVYQEPSSIARYVSPYKNICVGKIEKFQEETMRLGSKERLIVSPRFGSSPDQLMFVRFSYDEGLTAALHFLGRDETDRSFSFSAVVTVFSHRAEMKDFVKETTYVSNSEENVSEIPILFLNPDTAKLWWLVDRNGTLYYKIVIENIY